jgi:hypothetical protein
MPGDGVFYPLFTWAPLPFPVAEHDGAMKMSGKEGMARRKNRKDIQTKKKGTESTNGSSMRHGLPAVTVADTISGL